MLVPLLGLSSLAGFFVFIIWTVVNLIRKRPKKVPIIGFAACFVIFWICIFADSSDSNEEQDRQMTAEIEQNDTENQDLSNSSFETAEIKQAETTTVAPTPTPTQKAIIDEDDNDLTKAYADEAKEDLKAALEDKYGLVWFGSVRNDTTGNWRLSEYASSEPLEDFSVDYYKAYFEDDKEIHAVINMSTSVTGKISKLSDDLLDVTLFEYVSKEEHDADKLFSGMFLKEYFVTISTGEIEEIQ